MLLKYINKKINALLLFFLIGNPFSTLSQTSDHEKAIQAVKDEEILPLDIILNSIKQKYSGRILAINLKDNEQGLFGWVYDIRMIDSTNKVINLRVDAGTASVLMVEQGG
tara:strand:- start:176 stop:505 length:330 start_codon:yes stop_codon:yes gene_type:complete